MIAKCVSASGYDLSEGSAGLYFTKESIFDVVPGRDYEVHEIALFNSGLILLVVDESELPSWYPIELFEVTDGRIPADWMFSRRAVGTSAMEAVWGHQKLVADPAIDEALANRDDRALEVFWEVASWSDSPSE
jgi:hypothetical protein